MMRRKHIKIFAAIIALLLAGIMLFSTLSSAFLYAGAASSVSSLKNQLSGIASQKEAVKKEIAALGDKLSAASERKAALDQQMELTQDEIDTTEALIQALAGQIEEKEAELVVAQADLDKKAALFATRVRVMYESGNISYLDVLLNAGDMSDMLSCLDKVTQVMDYDKKVMEDYRQAKEELEIKKASLEQDKADEVAYKGTLQSKYDSLASSKKEQESIMAQLNANIEEKKKQTEKMEAEQAEINAEIERLSRLAAEEARRKAELAKQQSKSGSGGGSGSSGGGVSTPTSGTFTWPLPGYGSGSITSPYGYRKHPITGKRKLHAGLDLGAPKGTTIVAAASGTVVKSYMSSSYGNYTVIDHGGGVMTAYAHQSKRLVSAGDRVSAGQKIGLVGSTGNSTGNHLHFEVYVNGSTVNPMNYFG